jgi:hypothetical protein
MRPELLAALSAHSFDPSTVRSEYSTLLPLWQLYLDLAEPDQQKIAALVQRHSTDEPAAKYALRQQLATAFNLCPTIIEVMRLYLWADEPTIDVGDDPQLAAFLANCDGAGTRWTDYVRQTILPMALAMGWVDVLVTNPPTTAEIATEADARAADLQPRAGTLLPTQRLNWSCRPDDSYNWACFQDRANESPTPFDRMAQQAVSYVSLLAPGVLAGSGIREDRAVWIRSSGYQGALSHDVGYCPTQRLPLATLYYAKANDPARRHFGVSKLAMAAALTKTIIQLLSWIHEDILANLAITCLPSKGGQAPTDDQGNPLVSQFSAFSVIWVDSQSTMRPQVLQGDVSHIRMKLELALSYVKEILRLSHLAGVYGEAAGEEKSGFHAMVNRAELTNELSDLASRLDRFTLEVLALAKSWATGEDWSVERLTAANPRLAVRWYKGPYNVEPLRSVLRDAAASIDLLGEFSPTLVRNVLKAAARSVIYQDDPELQPILDEIERLSSDVSIPGRLSSLLAQAAAINDGKASMNVSENGEASAGDEA